MGTKASDSNSEYDPSSNSGSESKGIGGDFAGNSDSEEAKASDPSQENEDKPCLYVQTKSSWHLMFLLIPIYSENGAVHNGSGTQGVKELESKIRNESSAGYAKICTCKQFLKAVWWCTS